MEAKKSKDANLEKKRKGYLQIGLIVSMSLVLVAFEYTTFTKHEQKVSLGEDISFIETEIIPVVTMKKKPDPRKKHVDISLAPVTKPDPIQNPDPTPTPDPNPNPDLNTGLDTIIFTPEPVGPPQIFEIVEEMPEYAGGMAQLKKFMSENLHYPVMARENDIQGIVYVQFVVSTDGTIKDVKLLNDIGGGCGKESMRVVRKMPDWTPGKQRGKPVNVRYTLPVTFKLK